MTVISFNFCGVIVSSLSENSNSLHTLLSLLNVFSALFAEFTKDFSFALSDMHTMYVTPLASLLQETGSSLRHASALCVIDYCSVSTPLLSSRLAAYDM